MQIKITRSGTMNVSFQEGRDNLKDIGELEISTKHVQRLTERTGLDLVRQRDAEAEAFEKMTLPERREAPPGVVAPDLAVVQADGGRAQVFDRIVARAAASSIANEGAAIEGMAETSSTDPSATEAIHGAEAAASEEATTEPTKQATGGAASASGNSRSKQPATHWRETKVGTLTSMESEEHESDPCPQIPDVFLNLNYVSQLAREIGHCPAGVEASAEEGGSGQGKQQRSEPSESDPKSPDKRHERPGLPKIRERTLVATLRTVAPFALLLAAAAWKRGFHAARRKAFLGDGSSTIWSVWRKYFSHYEPIVDFIHALSYVFAAAMAGLSQGEGRVQYERWIQWVWAGETDNVIAALKARLAALGPADANDSATSPRSLVAQCLTYLQNQGSRMQYAKYRKMGLPITTCHVESAVKQIGRRVKSTEKFWSEAGIEAILALRAAHQSDGEPMAAYWQHRQATATGQRQYSAAL